MLRSLAVILLAFPLTAQTPHPTTKADVERLMHELSNWNRWGKNDQIGTVNLITPAKRKEAALLVREGVSVSLARDAETEKAADNPAPFVHKFTYTGAKPLGQFVLDNYAVDYHGQAHTHMDALCHMFYEGKFYNGFSQSTVTDKGAQQLAITNFKNGIFTRGILVNIPKLKGLPYLEPSTAIYPEDLDAWEQKTGLHISSGDVVFIYTGRWKRRAEKGAWDAGAQAAGLHVSCAKWFKHRDIAMIGSDLGTDVMPSQVDGVSQPLHQLFLIAMGTPIFDNCDLEALSRAAAARNRYAFLLTAAPLSVPGGTGSPLNPIATF